MEFFSLKELTNGREDQITPAVRANLVNMVERLLDPWRRKVGRLRVTSAWRTEEENRRANGERRSQHLSGEAVDVAPLDCPQHDAFDALNGLQFDQAIIYPRTGHIHVSLNGPISTRTRNRGARYRSPGRDGKVKYERV